VPSWGMTPWSLTPGHQGSWRPAARTASRISAWNGPVTATLSAMEANPKVASRWMTRSPGVTPAQRRECTSPSRRR
jgi:hypothetical protein